MHLKPSYSISTRPPEISRFNSISMLCLFMFFLLVYSIPAYAQTKVGANRSKAPAHETWDALLKKWVDSRGMVNYQGFLQDHKQLQAYLQQLQTNAPDEKKWSKEEQLAYWINAYNAYTIELVLRNYPLESIKDVKLGQQMPFVTASPWDLKFIKAGGRELSLNNIEHNIIRPAFKEPRIHFALVCAARSCPKLRQEAYVAERLDAQLADQARSFLLDHDKNDVRSNKLELSKLFDWYQSDFTEGRTLQEAISEYSGMPINKDAKVSYRYYSWKLNEQSK